MGDLKKLSKDKEISEDEERRASADIDKLIKDVEAQIAKATEAKEKDLMAI
ncbi:Ribosome-recycling factor [compost metagenome]